MELTITSKGVNGGAETLALTGAIDLVTRDEVVEAGAAVFAEGLALELDMAEVTFIDSTGIGALVKLHNLAKTTGLGVSIPRRSTCVTRILEVTGLSDAWTN